MYCQQHQNKTQMPLCMFGPGGDYRKTWPTDSCGLADYDAIGLFGRIGIVLAWLADVLYRLWSGLNLVSVQISDRSFQSRKDDDVLMPVSADTVTSVCHSFRSVQLWRCTDDPFSPKKKVSQKDTTYPDPKTSTDTASNPFLSRRQWLFPNFEGNGRPSSVKQSNRFRARGNTRAKRRSASFAQQGTLFDD